jgi:predicted nucleotidyltransferase/HEPN domain-containing protein
MKHEIDHLPAKQQGELERITQLLMDEFARSIERATMEWKRNGKILKIILFGSYARNDWVDEPDNGYQSDYDLLIVVSHEDLTDIADHWYIAEDRILRDPAIGRTVNIIVHTMQDVNQALRRGEYFWVDIIRDGIALYELPNHPLAAPQPMTASDASEMAKSYFEDGLSATDRALRTVALQTAEGIDDGGWRKEAAFSLHQAVERAYGCFLLTHTFYFPRSHNIKFLRSLAEGKEQRLVAAWPRDTKIDRRRFELLKRAYVEARYSPSYEIGADDLEALAAAANRLRDIVEQLCNERIEHLRREAAN